MYIQTYRYSKSNNIVNSRQYLNKSQHKLKTPIQCYSKYSISVACIVLHSRFSLLTAQYTDIVLVVSKTESTVSVSQAIVRFPYLIGMYLFETLHIWIVVPFFYCFSNVILNCTQLYER